MSQATAPAGGRRDQGAVIPAHPDWPDRDRFVLSGGHASMVLYGALHLAGYDVPMPDIRRFRQVGSACAGHPERGLLPGIEVTTGPLGQGVANAVGLAIAECLLAARFNVGGFSVVNHRVIVECGDGDLMEGVSAEASSLAGHLGLGKLTLLYDDNQVTVAAVVRAVLRTPRGRTRCRAAARDAAGRGRGGEHVRLGRDRRPGGRHDDVRRVGPRRRPLPAFRHHGAGRRRCRPHAG